MRHTFAAPDVPMDTPSRSGLPLRNRCCRPRASETAAHGCSVTSLVQSVLRHHPQATASWLAGLLFSDSTGGAPVEIPWISGCSDRSLRSSIVVSLEESDGRSSSTVAVARQPACCAEAGGFVSDRGSWYPNVNPSSPHQPP